MFIVGLQAGVARTSNEVDGTILGYCVNLRNKTRCKQFLDFIGGLESHSIGCFP